MLIALIVLVLVLGVVAGYTLRLWLELRQHKDEIEDLNDFVERQQVELSKVRDKNVTLERENVSLAHMNRSHVSSLEILLGELGESA